MTTRLAASSGLASLLLALAGCGGTATHAAPDLTDAEVVVTLNNQPLPNAQVTLTPADEKYGGAAVATGVTDASGRAKLTCGGRPGACLGPNRVTVAEGPPPDAARSDNPDVAQRSATQHLAGLKNRPIPPKYATLAESDLTVEVTKDRSEYRITLTR